MNPKPRILFVCALNQWRSPTAAGIYAKDQRIEVRSAGVSAKSRRRISREDIKWADLILVMEQEHKERILDQFRDVGLPRIESLDIPDDYEYMNNELADLIREGTEHYLEDWDFT